MIKIFQKYMKSFVFTLISFLIAFSMLGFGVDFFGGRGGDYVAKVDGEKISREELRSLRDELEARYKAAWGDYYAQAAEMLHLDLDKEARENIVNVFLVNRVAKDLGFAFGEYGVAEKIKGMFPNGQIDMATYENFLRQRRQTAPMFENEIRQRGATGQLETVIQELSYASKAEAMKLMEEDDTTYGLQYVEFNPEDYVAKVEDPKDDVLMKFFEEKANNYEKNAQVSYKYVSFIPETLLNIVELTPEDSEVYYAEHEKDFTVPDTATIQMIRVPVARVEADKKAEDEAVKEEDKTEEEKKADEEALQEKQKAAKAEAKDKAEKALDELKNEGDFATIAKSFLSEEELKDENAVERALKNITVRKGERRLPPMVSKAVFNLAQVGYTDVVEDMNAYYIVKISEFKPTEVEPFEKVKANIEEILKRQAAPAWTYDYAYGLFDEWKKSGKDLTQFAADKALEVKESKGLLDAEHNPEGVFFNLTETVLKFPSEKVQIAEVGKNLALIEIQDYKEAYLPEFAEVKDAVKADYAKEQSVVLAKQAADGVVQAFSDTKVTDLAGAVKDDKIEVKEEKDKKLVSLSAPLSNEEIIAEVSGVSQIKVAPKASHAVDGKYYVVQVVDIKKPDLATVDSKKLDEYRQKASDRNAQELMAMLFKQMKISSDIEERL